MKPSAIDVYQAILNAAEHQIATTSGAKAIRSAGMEEQLRSVIQEIAANAANPIVDMFEEHPT